MLIRLILGALATCCFVGSAAASELIDYNLLGSWTYEEGHPGTLSLSDSPFGGITASINVPSGIDDGGLTASRHALPGFSLGNDGFIQVAYGNLTSTITGTASLNLVLEVEFYDVNSVRYQMAMAIWQDNETSIFETWFAADGGFAYDFEIQVPDGLSLDEGALGLYSDSVHVLPYFQYGPGSVLYPFTAWDLSGIAGALNFSVDNDFEADTANGGTVIASVDLRQVEYGVPEPATLSLLALGGLAFLRRKRR